MKGTLYLCVFIMPHTRLVWHLDWNRRDGWRNSVTWCKILKAIKNFRERIDRIAKLQYWSVSPYAQYPPASQLLIIASVTHFTPMLHFYTTWRRQKTIKRSNTQTIRRLLSADDFFECVWPFCCFLTFSRGIEIECWCEIGYADWYPWNNRITHPVWKKTIAMFVLIVEIAQ